MPAPKDPEQYEAWKRKISEGTKKAMQRPEIRQKYSEAGKRRRHSPATKAKMTAAQKERHAKAGGDALSPESRARVTEALKGRKKSPETIAKTAASRKGQKPYNKGLSMWSEEDKARMSADRKGKPNPKNRHPMTEAQKAKLSAMRKEQWEKLTDGQKAKKVTLLIDSTRGSKETWIEEVVAQRLDEQGIIYERQKQIGWYKVDFYVPAENKVIEVNGCFWHGCERCGKPFHVDRREADAKRYAYLRRKGYIVEIIWEHELPRKPP